MLRRGGKKTQKNCTKKDFHDPDNHDDINTHLELDILEWDVKWALGSITTNKASGGDRISVELFQILKDDAVKMLHSICQHIWKTQAQDWTRSVFIAIPKKGNAKEYSNNCTIALISHASKVMLKILQARLQQYMKCELPDVQAGFRKGRETRDQIANILWITEKAREFRKNIYFCFIDYTKVFDCVDHNLELSCSNQFIHVLGLYHSSKGCALSSPVSVVAWSLELKELALEHEVMRIFNNMEVSGWVGVSLLWADTPRYDNGRGREELGPAQIKDKETTYFSFFRSRRTSWLHMQKDSLGAKKGGGTSSCVIGGISLLIGLCTRIRLS